MYRVNIDKLVNVDSDKKKDFEHIAEDITGNLNLHKSVAVIGGRVDTFRIAYGIMEKGNKVLFIDGDIKRQAANFTVDGLYVVSDIFARIDAVILFEGAVKGVIIRKTAFGRDGRDRLFFHEQPFGFQQPLLDDILVKADLHILLEHVGKIVFINEKRLCHRVQ